MSLPSTDTAKPDSWAMAEVQVELWRDYDPDAQRVAGVRIGNRWVGGDLVPSAESLYLEGVRCVRISEPVALCAKASARDARALVLIRELTARGIVVAWIATCTDEH